MSSRTKMKNKRLILRRVPALFAIVCLCAALSGGCGDSTGKSAAAGKLEAGKKIYGQYCAACHQTDGSGVPDMQPDLRSNAVVKGDDKTLIKVVLEGPAQVLPAERERYSNVMPPFSTLSDEDVAALLTYLRKQYGDGTSVIDAPQVAAVRAQSAKAP
jgi:mono/diheme cytochrome c family protein